MNKLVSTLKKSLWMIVYLIGAIGIIMLVIPFGVFLMLVQTAEERYVNIGDET